MTVAATAHLQAEPEAAPPRARMDSPTRLWAMLLAAALAVLLAGSVAGVGLSGRESTAGHTAQATEPLYQDVQELSYALADANATAANALLIGPVAPKADTDRFGSDITLVEQRLSDASQRVTGDATASEQLDNLAEQVPQYAQWIGQALANNRFGYPVAGAYLRQASQMYTGHMLVEVQAVIAEEQSATQDGMSSASSPDWLTIALCVLALTVLIVVGRMMARTSRRRLNLGVLGAALAVLALLVWTCVAALGSSSSVDQARTDFSQVSLAQDGNSELALAETYVALQQIDRGEDVGQKGGDDQQHAEKVLADLTKIGNGFTDTSSGPVTADVQKLVTCADGGIRLAADGQYQKAITATVGSEQDLGSGCETAAAKAVRDDFDGATNASQARYAADMSRARSWYAGGAALALALVVGLLGAVAAAWGVNRRLAEYR